MKIGNEEIDKNLVIYFAVAIILSGLLGFYGGRFFERNNFRKMVRERQNFEDSYRTGHLREYHKIFNRKKQSQHPPKVNQTKIPPIIRTIPPIRKLQIILIQPPTIQTKTSKTGKTKK
jgi:hypothetical protein